MKDLELKVLEALQTIQNYCNEKSCKDCRFSNKNDFHNCFFNEKNLVPCYPEFVNFFKENEIEDGGE